MAPARDVAVVSTAQTPHRRRVDDRNEVEMLMPVLEAVKGAVGVTQDDLDFTCSGSTDYLAGQAFSFVTILDGVGPYPPIVESHVEQDGAWALYEAWVKIQTGAADTALVYAYGKSSPGDLPRVLSRQLDPYYTGPLWPDSISLAALQGRALLDSGRATEVDFAEVAARSRAAARANPNATISSDTTAEEILAEPHLVSPLRRHDCPPISDGAAAVILAADDTARELTDSPAWIRGIDHRIDVQALGQRDLTDSPSARLAAEKAGVADGPVDVAELHACFTPQELILRESMGLDADVVVNPSGGPLAANTVMAAGLVRIAEAAERVASGQAGRAVAHATSGPCLQQNLVCVIDGDR
jgi:acetyl-CoA acetyltransferase